MTDGFLFNLEQVSITFRQNLATSSLSEAHNLSIATISMITKYVGENYADEHQMRDVVHRAHAFSALLNSVRILKGFMSER